MVLRGSTVFDAGYQGSATETSTKDDCMCGRHLVMGTQRQGMRQRMLAVRLVSTPLGRRVAGCLAHDGPNHTRHDGPNHTRRRSTPRITALETLGQDYRVCGQVSVSKLFRQPYDTGSSQ